MSYPRKAREDNKIDPAVALIASLTLSFALRRKSPRHGLMPERP
jgi:hypothetical protein